MPGPTVPSWLSLLPLSKWRLTLGHAWASGRSVPHVGARSPCTGCLHGLVEVARGDRVCPTRAFGESQDRCRLCRLPSSRASVEAEAASSVCPLFSPPLLGCPAGRGTFWKNVNLFSSCKTHMQELASKSRRLESWIKQQENCRRKQGRRCRSSATSLCPVKAAASPGLSLPSLRVSPRFLQTFRMSVLSSVFGDDFRAGKVPSCLRADSRPLPAGVWCQCRLGTRWLTFPVQPASCFGK